MKIKEVCERTGLTDRAVRHYIEEKLIAPEYSENYLGRKTFYFTEADVRTLLDIAVLRRIGFSVPDIRAIENDPNSSTARIDALRGRGRAIVVITHDMDLALRLADRVAILGEGRLQAIGPARDLLLDARLMAENGLAEPLLAPALTWQAGR